MINMKVELGNHKDHCLDHDAFGQKSLGTKISSASRYKYVS